ncbi:MAG: hypothetical protein V3R68_07325 [Gammaproteobacteria bacterium]
MTTRDLGTPLRGGVKMLETQEQFPVPVNFDSAWIPDNRFAVAYRDIGKEREQERKLFRYDELCLWGNSMIINI